MNHKSALHFIVAIFLVSGFSCHERGPGPDFVKFFDQKGFLVHVGQNMIIPAYKDLTEKGIALDTAVSQLIKEASQENLASARLALREAWLAWQYCAPFEFGPARLLGLADDVNPFPADTARIESNMRKGLYNINLPENHHAKGFAALDYLLNNKALTDEEVLSAIYNRIAYKGYLVQASGVISFSANAVHKFWSPEEGDYFAIFTADQALGVKDESSVSDLVNGLCRSLEFATINAKVGTPLGQGSNGLIKAEATEAFYGGYSLELLKANLHAFQLIFIGQTKDGEDGLGFDEYLHIKGARLSDSSQALEEAILSRYGLVNLAMQQASDPLSLQIQNSPPAVRQIYNQLLTLNYLYKVEMASALRVEINY